MVLNRLILILGRWAKLMCEGVERLTEPWMRGTHPELDPLRRGVLHALEQAEEDADRWCADLGDEQMFARPPGLPAVAFHMRHAARSLDRLLTYAEGRMLDEEQLARLRTEMDPGTAEDVRREFRDGLVAAKRRLLAFDPGTYPEACGIGRKQLPTTVGGLLIHSAEHTQRHVGQMVTTVKVVKAELHQGAARQ